MAKDEVLAWIKVPKPVPGEPSAAPSRPKQAGAPVPSARGSATPKAREATSVGAEFLRVYKISKRYDDDISAVCLALNLQIENGKVLKASVGAGGVAATPVRASQTEAVLTGRPWSQETVRRAITTLRAEFSPISDMRASGAYRSEVLGNLLQRFWLESQGLQQINLESFVLVEESA